MKIVRLDNFADLLKKVDETKERIAFLAGGTDIMPAVNGGYFHQDIVFDLSPFSKELNFIRKSEEGIEIGSLVCLSEVAKNIEVVSKIPQLADAINLIGSKQIRNMGTLAGNIANASPIADSAPVLLTKNAIVNVVSDKGERSIPIEKFFIDYKKTALQKNEIIKSVFVPYNEVSGRYGFKKVACQKDAISKITFAYAIEKNRTRFAAGGATKMPVRLTNTEHHWGERNSVGEWEKIISEDISPITDLRSTAEYRSRVLANIISEHALSSQE